MRRWFLATMGLIAAVLMSLAIIMALIEMNASFSIKLRPSPEGPR